MNAVAGGAVLQLDAFEDEPREFVRIGACPVADVRRSDCEHRDHDDGDGEDGAHGRSASWRRRNRDSGGVEALLTG
jgi:hypothetical protein